MKKQYMKPQMEAIEIQNACQILAGSMVSDISGDGFIYEGGSKETARAPMFDDDDWE